MAVTEHKSHVGCVGHIPSTNVIVEVHLVGKSARKVGCFGDVPRSNGWKTSFLLQYSLMRFNRYLWLCGMYTAKEYTTTAIPSGKWSWEINKRISRLDAARVNRCFMVADFIWQRKRATRNTVQVRLYLLGVQ